MDDVIDVQGDGEASSPKASDKPASVQMLATLASQDGSEKVSESVPPPPPPSMSDLSVQHHDAADAIDPVVVDAPDHLNVGMGKKRLASTKKSCCCGWELCRTLTRKYLEAGDIRAGHASLPMPEVKYNVDKNAFLRKRWLECLGFDENSKQVKGNKDVRISKAHFRLADFQSGKLRRWTPGRQSINENDIFTASKRKETLAIPSVTEEEMRQELLRMREGKYQVSVEPPDMQHRSEMEQKLAKYMEESERLSALVERLTNEKEDAVQAGRRIGDTLRREVLLRDKKISASEAKIKELQNKLGQGNQGNNPKHLQRELAVKDKRIESLLKRVQELEEQIPGSSKQRSRKHASSSSSSTSSDVHSPTAEDDMGSPDASSSNPRSSKRARTNSTLTGADHLANLLNQPRVYEDDEEEEGESA